MLWKTSTRLFIYNPNNEEISWVINHIVKVRPTKVFYIFDKDHYDRCGHINGSFCTSYLQEFNELIKHYVHRKYDTSSSIKVNPNFKIHYVFIRKSNEFKTVTKNIKDNIRALCFADGILHGDFTVSTCENFYVSLYPNTIYRITSISNSDYSGYIKCDTAGDTQTLLRIAGVEPESIVDGPGMRYTIFVQGCPHHCDGCHNANTWDFSEGYFVTVQSLFNDIIQNPMIQGVTFSGGEPLMQAQSLYYLATLLKHHYFNVNKKSFNIITYTGFTKEYFDKILDERKNNKYISNSTYYQCLLITHSNYIIDGKFEKDKKSLNCKFRGSTNQRMFKVERFRTPDNLVTFTEVFPVNKDD